MNEGGGVIGGLITLILYIVAKITLSDLASIATICSGSVVILVNLPKVIDVYSKYIKPLFIKLKQKLSKLLKRKK